MQKIWYGGHPLRYPLLPLSVLTAVVVGARRAWYRRVKPAPASLPVVVVGNLTVGGTGKTPLVATIARRLKREGRRPGIISRGYGAKRRDYPHLVQSGDAAAAVGDEPLLLHRDTGCPVVIDPDRRRALDWLVANTDANLVIGDDGLQHYRLHRDVEIVVIDGREGFGNGWLLPAGPLREPRSRLEEVDFTVVNGANDAGAPREEQFSMQLRPLAFKNLSSGERVALNAFAGRVVHACAGIAHPRRFFDTLNALGARVIEHAYPDHHRYRAEDLRFVPGAPVIVTEKDAVKCAALVGEPADGNIWSLRMEAMLKETFWRALAARLESRSGN